jgi:hypothetical protein
MEWVADSLVGTNYSQGYRDTTIDLFNDTIAAIASGILVAVWICAHAARTGLPPLMVEGRSGGALKRHVA